MTAREIFMKKKMVYGSPDYHMSWLGHKVFSYGRKGTPSIGRICECGQQWNMTEDMLKNTHM